MNFSLAIMEASCNFQGLLVQVPALNKAVHIHIDTFDILALAPKPVGLTINTSTTASATL